MLYINGRFLTRPMTGVERYAYTVCLKLAEQTADFSIVCPKAPILSCYDTSRLPIIFFGHGNSHFWEQCVLPFFFIGKKDYVLLNLTGLGTILIGNKITTIHDLSFLENPKWFSRPYYLWYKLMTPLAVKTSKHVITVSEFSKREILRFYGSGTSRPCVKEEDISVAYCAADSTRFRVVGEEQGARSKEQGTRGKEQGARGKEQGDKFVLAVSSFDPRKNFARLIQAFEQLPEYELRIVGSHNRVFTAEGHSAECKQNIRFLGRVSDDELLTLYNQAAAFVFPSIYEGFGLPPIEAMHCGCPVLAADIPVIREVCADAANYFDPYSVESIRDAIKSFFQHQENSRATMQEKGFANIQRFSWDATATVIKNIAEQINRSTQ